MKIMFLSKVKKGMRKPQKQTKRNILQILYAKKKFFYHSVNKIAAWIDKLVEKKQTKDYFAAVLRWCVNNKNPQILVSGFSYMDLDSYWDSRAPKEVLKLFNNIKYQKKLNFTCRELTPAEYYEWCKQDITNHVEGEDLLKFTLNKLARSFKNILEFPGDTKFYIIEVLE